MTTLHKLREASGVTEHTITKGAKMFFQMLEDEEIKNVKKDIKVIHDIEILCCDNCYNKYK